MQLPVWDPNKLLYLGHQDRSEILKLDTWIIGVRKCLIVEIVQCTIGCQSTSLTFLPADARSFSIPQVVTTKNVSRHHQTFLDRPNHTQLRPTEKDQLQNMNLLLTGPWNPSSTDYCKDVRVFQSIYSLLQLHRKKKISKRNKIDKKKEWRSLHCR